MNARDRESDCRKAYRRPFMREGMDFLADTYAETAELWRRRLREYCEDHEIEYAEVR